VRPLRQLAARVRAQLLGRRMDAELIEEVRLHLELLAEEHQHRGLSPEAARLAALRDFGGVSQTVERYRDHRGLPFLDTLAQDLRYAFRMYRRAPGFSAVVVIVLALGIGANSAMFTLVNALLFRPLSGRVGDLVGLYSHDPAKPNSYRIFSYLNYRDVRDRNDVFSSLIAQASAQVGTPDGDLTKRLFVSVVSNTFFSTLGVQLAAGRAFTADEERPGSKIPVAVASYDAWRRSGFDPGFVGRTVRLNAIDYTIVGIAPDGFTGTNAILARDYWLPIGTFGLIVTDALRKDEIDNRANRSFFVSGLLKPGVSIELANTRLASLSADLAREFPAENSGHLLTVHRLSRVNISSTPSSDAGPAVLSAVVMPLSGAVLLIACLNIANMLLARATARKKEIAVRLAIGGGRGRIIRQLMTESLLLAAAGAAGGLLTGWWTARLFTHSLVAIMPVTMVFDPRPDVRIVLATAVFACLAAVGFGLAPALRISRPDVVDDLKDLGASRDSSGQIGTHAWLVVGQVAASLVLMTAGSLFARAALKADVADPGYRYDGLLLASVDPGLAHYDALASFERLQAALERLRRVPGVAAVGVNSQVPFGDYHQSIAIERLGHRDNGGREPTYTLVTSDYFSAVGLPMLRGRTFSTAEEQALRPPQTAIIDEPLARRLFGDDDPIGQQLVIPARADDRSSSDGRSTVTIIGLVPGIRDELTEREPASHLYIPWTRPAIGPMHFHIRASNRANAASLLAVIRAELRAMDARLPIVDLKTMQQFHDRGLVLWMIRTAGRVLMGLGVLALLLAAIGIYGVKSYVVSQRTREIGIRIALGARPRAIGLMLFRDGARTTLLGLAIGFPLALLLGRALSVAIFEVSAFDPIALTVAPSVLAAAAALATYLPARRGMGVAPLEALRAE